MSASEEPGPSSSLARCWMPARPKPSHHTDCPLPSPVLGSCPAESHPTSAHPRETPGREHASSDCETAFSSHQLRHEGGGRLLRVFAQAKHERGPADATSRMRCSSGMSRGRFRSLRATRAAMLRAMLCAARRGSWARVKSKGSGRRSTAGIGSPRWHWLFQNRLQ